MMFTVIDGPELLLSEVHVRIKPFPTVQRLHLLFQISILLNEFAAIR